MVWDDSRAHISNHAFQPAGMILSFKQGNEDNLSIVNPYKDYTTTFKKVLVYFTLDG